MRAASAEAVARAPSGGGGGGVRAARERSEQRKGERVDWRVRRGREQRKGERVDRLNGYTGGYETGGW